MRFAAPPSRDRRTAHYREQAGKIRAMAENEPPGAIREKLLLIAAQYDDLVEHLEERAD